MPQTQKEWLDEKIIQKLDGTTSTSNFTMLQEIFNLGLVKGGLRNRLINSSQNGNYPTNKFSLIRTNDFGIFNPNDVIEMHQIVKFDTTDSYWGLFGTKGTNMFLANSLGYIKFYSYATANYVSFPGSAPIDLRDGKYHMVGMRVYNNGSVMAFVDGIQYGGILTNQFTPENNWTEWKYFFGGYGSYGESQGDVYACYAFNRALTDAERTSLCKFIVPEALNNRGFVDRDVVNNPTNGGAGWQPMTTFSWDGSTLNCTSASGNPGTCGIRINGLKNGTKIKVSGNVTAFSGGNIQLGLSNSNNDTPDYIGIGSTGWFEHTFTQYIAGFAIEFIVLNYADSVARSLTVENLKFEVQGCMVNCQPQNILPSGRWIDISGNCNDLMPSEPNPYEIIYNPKESYSREYDGVVVSTGISGEEITNIISGDIGKTSITGKEALYFNSQGGYLAPDVIDKTGPYPSGPGSISTRIISLNGSTVTGGKSGKIIQTMS